MARGGAARSEVLISADEIDYPRVTKADVIVMSTHGRSGIGRWVFGSVADQVLRGAEEGAPVTPYIALFKVLVHQGPVHNLAMA